MEICIDLGLKAYDITDPAGNVVGEIRFNPSDAGMAVRWVEAEKNIKELAAQATGRLDTTTTGQLDELDSKIKAQLDYAFGTPVSAVLFRSVSSLAMCTNGRLVLENVLEGVTPVIEAATQAAAAAGAARIKKHTGKYAAEAKAGLAPEQQA